MSPFEIALIIIGIVCIVGSCFLIDHGKEDTVDTEIGTVTEQILYQQLSEANDKISSHINQIKDEVYEKTQEDMNRISNEKMMAVHEYSDQVLNDIKKSHNEVLFLYQMLTEKEEDLKSTLTEMQRLRREMEHYCRSVDDGQNIDAVDAKSQTKEMNGHGKKAQKQKANEKQEQHYTKALKEIEDQEFAGHIDEIISLADQGCSVIEISKRLGLGQGEVKLVLDYNKR